ncbi:hypothetical protein I6F11_17670 [Ensifer sp. NBAIM29]|nr:hypothetical protein [Ensifer sp. NBAIM29]
MRSVSYLQAQKQNLHFRFRLGAKSLNINELTVTAKELGDVLDLTDRRVRQLADEGVFERSGRGRYPLAACVQAYIASLNTNEADDSLRAERVALMRAQRRRIEIDNDFRAGTENDMQFQDVMIGALSTWWIIWIRPVATWLHEELRQRGIQDATPIAGTVQNWLISLRHQGEVRMKAAAAEARRKGIAITSYDDLARLIPGGYSEPDSAADADNADE